MASTCLAILDENKSEQLLRSALFFKFKCDNYRVTTPRHVIITTFDMFRMIRLRVARFFDSGLESRMCVRPSEEWAVVRNRKFPIEISSPNFFFSSRRGWGNLNPRQTRLVIWSLVRSRSTEPFEWFHTDNTDSLTFVLLVD